MQSPEEILRELERRGKAQELQKMADSEQGQRLGKMIDGAAIEKAARSGDTEALKALVRTVLFTEDGKALAQQLQTMLGK